MKSLIVCLTILWAGLFLLSACGSDGPDACDRELVLCKSSVEVLRHRLEELGEESDPDKIRQNRMEISSTEVFGWVGSVCANCTPQQREAWQ